MVPSGIVFKELKKTQVHNTVLAINLRLLAFQQLMSYIYWLANNKTNALAINVSGNNYV